MFVWEGWIFWVRLWKQCDWSANSKTEQRVRLSKWWHWVVFEIVFGGWEATFAIEENTGGTCGHTLYLLHVTIATSNKVSEIFGISEARWAMKVICIIFLTGCLLGCSYSYIRCVKVNRTFSGYSQDFFRTFLGLFQDCIRNFSGTSQDFIRIFSGLSQDFTWSLSRLSHDFLGTFSRFS